MGLFSEMMDDASEKDREIARLREAITRAEYYINRLEAAYRGHVVRDLDEACNAFESYKARLNRSVTAHEEQS